MSHRQFLSGTLFVCLLLAACSGRPAADGTSSNSQISHSAPPIGILSQASKSEAPLLRSTDPGAERFIPVGRLRTGDGGYNCTGSVIAGADAPAPNRRALILTAGHCVAESGDNTVIVDQPAGSAWSFTPAYFVDTQDRHRSFGVFRVLYSTMKRVDLAVLELDATYGDLAELGLHPLHLRLADSPPETPVELVHVPVLGVPTSERFLRHSLCLADTRRSLVEPPGPWWWEAATPNDCKGVAGGTSGSPVFLRGGSDVIAVLNTTSSPNYVGCGLSRPCEVGEDNQLHSYDDTSYAIPVDRLVRALQPDSTLDLTRLDDGRGIVLNRIGGTWVSQRTEIVDGVHRPARWQFQIEGEFPLVRYKVGPARSTRCADIAGYSDALSVSDQPLRDLATPEQDGVYVACAIGGTVGGIWQSPADATQRLRRIDNMPPTRVAQLERRVHEGKLEVAPVDALWDIEEFYVKYGLADDVDCQDPAGFQFHARGWWYLVEPIKPWRICVYGVDEAENAGPVQTFDFNQQPSMPKSAVKTTDSASAQ